jgi:polyphosphate kinase
VHVVYGLVGLKTHSKTALVVRQEGDGIRRYCHIGTGNYNASTARIYEDIGILTAAPEIGADLTDLFNFLTGYSRRMDYRRLLVAPLTLRPRMMELIAREADLGERGRIVWKLNNVVDPGIVDALYRASQAGVSIDLIVRAICCLRPGVAGLSDNIRVRSIVGRWLEHSRVYFFGAGAPDPGPLNGDAAATLPEGGDYYLGSADMMDRNLDRRVEAVVPILAPELQARLREILEIDLADDVRSWELRSDGSWYRTPTKLGVNAQHRFQELAVARSKRWREAEVLHGGTIK